MQLLRSTRIRISICFLFGTIQRLFPNHIMASATQDAQAGLTPQVEESTQSSVPQSLEHTLSKSLTRLRPCCAITFPESAMQTNLYGMNFRRTENTYTS